MIVMREYINSNIIEIKKHLKIRKKLISKSNELSILEEFKEWCDEPLPKKESIWTLPDLTCIQRYNNFRRAIKKEIK